MWVVKIQDRIAVTRVRPYSLDSLENKTTLNDWYAAKRKEIPVLTEIRFSLPNPQSNIHLLSNPNSKDSIKEIRVYEVHTVCYEMKMDSVLFNVVYNVHCH